MERVKNVEDYAEKYTEEHASSPEDYVTARGEPPHDLSLTEVAAQALRTGLYPTRKMEEVPGEDDLLRVGDPDVDPLDNLYSGESQPSGSAPTRTRGSSSRRRPRSTAGCCATTTAPGGCSGRRCA